MFINDNCYKEPSWLAFCITKASKQVSALFIFGPSTIFTPWVYFLFKFNPPCKDTAESPWFIHIKFGVLFIFYSFLCHL